MLKIIKILIKENNQFNYEKVIFLILIKEECLKLQLILLDDLFYRGTGPAGPAGESSLNTYGRKYNTTTDGINLETNIAQNIPLGSNGPSNRITTATQNTLTITENGIYLVNYSFSGSSSTAATITVEVKQNATSIGSTSIVKTVTPSTNTDFIGGTINTFNTGDQIGLDIKSSTATTITPSDGTNAYLNITRIS